MGDDWDEGTKESFGGGGFPKDGVPSGRGGGGFGGGGFGRGRGGGRGGFGGRSGGFGGEDEFGGSSGWENGNGDADENSFGGSRGGRGGRRGHGGRGGGGFGQRDRGENENEEFSTGGGQGGGRRGGFSGHRDQDTNGDGGRRGGGGFRNRRNQESNGDDQEFGSGGGFRGRRGGGGRGGFGGGRRDQESNGDGEEQGSGFGGGRRGEGRGQRRDDEDGGEEKDQSGTGRKTELYIPPAPPEDEGTLFATMAAGINFDKYDDINVEATGRDPPSHISSFDECDFLETTMKNVKLCNYARPTPVQKYAIPIIMAGRDLMACAQTGSGKTAAFLLPAITSLLRKNVQGASQAEQQSPQVLIISPTRELTLQIYGEARKFVHGTILRPVVVYGGTSVGHQLRQLEFGCNILVSTPGRLVDFLNRKKVLLDDLKVLILDEADRMLDMGFVPEIRRVVEQYNMPDKGERQTLMFSATFPGEIQQLAAEFLQDHIFLTVGVVGGTTSDIQQKVIEVEEFQKRGKLQEILSEAGSDRVLVFVETKRNADFLASFLSQESFPTTSIHGDRFQREREEALRDFRDGRARVLVATSVAARGLDIPKVKHVINYDLPNNIEEYVHRIGRTGRIGNQGMATAFFQKDRDAHLARTLVKVLAGAEQEVESFLEQAAEEAVGSNYGPAGDKFASKDIRVHGSGRRGFNKGDSSGFGDDGGSGGGFGGFDESAGGGFQASAAAGGEDW